MNLKNYRAQEKIFKTYSVAQ